MLLPSKPVGQPLQGLHLDAEKACRVTIEHATFERGGHNGFGKTLTAPRPVCGEGVASLAFPDGPLFAHFNVVLLEESIPVYESKVHGAPQDNQRAYPVSPNKVENGLVKAFSRIPVVPELATRDQDFGGHPIAVPFDSGLFFGKASPHIEIGYAALTDPQVCKLMGERKDLRGLGITAIDKHQRRHGITESETSKLAHR